MTEPRKPQDRRKKRDPFPFVIDGVEYELASPTFGAMEDMSNAENETKGVMALLASCTSEDALTAIRSLDAQDVNELFGDWMAAIGGGEPGKSSGSSD